MKIFIRASNTITNFKLIKETIALAIEFTKWEITEIIIDDYNDNSFDIALWARKNKIKVHPMLPNWKRGGHKAVYANIINILNYTDAVLIVSNNRLEFESLINNTKNKSKKLFYYDIIEKFHESL